MQPVPSQPHERTLAAAAHISAIPFPLVGPIVALVAAGRSPFVRRHAWRSLIESILMSVALFVGAITVFCIFTLPKLMEALRTSGQSLTWGDLWGALIRDAVVWVVVAVIGLLNTLNNVRQAVRAYHGRMP